GGAAIGTYATVNTAPTNGLIVSGNVGVGTTTPKAALDVTATGTLASAIIVPRDTTAGRPAANAANGMIRHNTNTNAFEAYANGSWQNIAVGAGVGTVQTVYNGNGLLGGPIN